MKTLIATALILTAGVANAQSFEYERQVGSAELYSTLATEGAISVDSSSSFAYQVNNGSTDLYPALVSEGTDPQPTSGRTSFTYQINVGDQELDPSLS